MSRYVCLDLTVDLLEDLHTGTGMGDSGMIDSVQARDPDGRYIIRATHFKGVLREQANLLRQMGALKSPGNVERLFGKGYDQRGSLQLTTLVAETNDLPKPPVLVASTAREENSRVPRDDTLRVVEYVPAGVQFRGQARLPAELVDVFRSALRATMFLGSGRTRGAGRVQIETSPEHAENDSMPTTTGKGNILRLRLENLEPLCLPASEQAGQLIATENFIRGQRLRAAFADWWTLRQNAPTGKTPPILAPGVCVSDGLCVPNNNDFASFGLAIPLPLSIYSPKPPGQTLGHLPWWAMSGQDPEKSEDLSLDVSREGEIPEGYKRPKADDVLVNTDDGWKRCRPLIQAHLRNRVPDRTQGNDKAELFAEEELAGNQAFLADIIFPDEEAARAFVGAHASLFNGSSWLRIGGGGRPVRIAGHVLADAAAGNTPADDAPLRIVLTADLILRTPNLNFATRLTPEILQDATGVAAESIRPVENGTFCESRLVFGWNAVTRRQRARALAIRRGSVFTFTGAGVPRLREVLQARHALGERQEEGFGRFVLDMDFSVVTTCSTRPAMPEILPLDAAEEQRLAQAQGIVNAHKTVFDKLSVTQWQWLRQMTRSPGMEWSDILDQILGHTEKRAGAAWRPVVEKLKTALPRISEDKQKDLAGCVATIMIQHTRQHRMKEKKDHGYQ